MEEKKSKDSLLLVQKKCTLWKCQHERDVARRLQRFGNTRRMKKEANSQDLVSFDSCRLSVVDQVEGVSLESSRKMQDEHEVMRDSMIFFDQRKRRRRVGGWNQKGKRRRWKPQVF